MWFSISPTLQLRQHFAFAFFLSCQQQDKPPVSSALTFIGCNHCVTAKCSSHRVSCLQLETWPLLPQKYFLLSVSSVILSKEKTWDYQIKRLKGLVEHPVLAERQQLDCQGSSDNRILCRWCHHTPGTPWSCTQQCRDTLGCFLLVVVWIPSYCTLESDSSTCWCKESIILHPILIWINTVPFQVCS